MKKAQDVQEEVMGTHTSDQRLDQSKRRWALGGESFADTRILLDRGWSRQKGHCHLRPRSPAPGLPQGPAAVSNTTCRHPCHFILTRSQSDP